MGRKKVNVDGCGVYVIKNTQTEKVYIGSSVCCSKRYKQHISELRGGRHANKHLQNSFDKWHEENFEFKVLFNCSKEERVKLEFKEIKKVVDKNGGKSLYNVVKNPDSVFEKRYTNKMRKDGYIMCQNCLEYFIPLLKNEDHIEIYEFYHDEYIEHGIEHENLCDDCLESDVIYIEEELEGVRLFEMEEELHAHYMENGMGENVYAFLPDFIIEDMITCGSWEE